MIRKAQIKFICIVMTILFCFFIIIFGISYIIMRNVNENTIERTLAEVEKVYHMPQNDDLIQNNYLIVKILPSASSQTSYTYICDENAFTETQINRIVAVVIKRASTSGSVGNVYYKITDDGYQQLIFAVDMTETMSLFSSSILKIFTALCIIYACLFFIVWRLSFSVFHPIREAFYKQKQFISNASHELKTPLTIISANTDVLKQNGDNHWLSNIKSQTERMDILIADMLTLAKIDEDKVKLSSENFNLSEEIINNSLPFDAVAFEKNKTLSLDIEPNVIYKGDVASVKKITNILLDNAVKHAKVGGEIIVSLKKENGKIIFSVFNTGSNVPPYESNKVFERFYRGDTSRSRESGGSGLGLSIAKSIADQNKWKISANSKLNESMTISVIL